MFLDELKELFPQNAKIISIDPKRFDGLTLGEVISKLNEENRINSPKSTEEDIDSEKNNPIDIDDGKFIEPRWGIMTSDKSKGVVTLVITAPFADQKSIKISVSKTNDGRTYNVTAIWSNHNIAFNCGNIKVKETDSITICGFKKLDKKRCSVRWENGNYILTLAQIPEKEQESFSFGI